MRAYALTTLTRPPFPVRVSAHVGDIAFQSTRWAAELGLVASSVAARRLDRANAAGLAGRACPDARPDQLRLLADLFTWLFTFDDRCDDDGLGDDPDRLAPVVGRLLDVLDLLGGAAPPDLAAVAEPTAIGLHDLCRRVRAQDSPWVLLRFVGQMRDYLLALLWEATNRARHRIPGVAEYLQMRRHTGAVRPSLTLTDLAYGGLTEGIRRADLDTSSLDDLATDLVCWCNDIFSHAKERRHGRDGHNLVVVLAQATGREERSGLADAVRRFNAGLRAYLRQESALLAGGDTDAARFVAARRAWIGGSFEWSLRAGRYRS